MNAAKAQRRQYFKTQITKALQTSDLTKMSHQVATQLERWPIWKKGMILAAYSAIKGELSPAYFLKKHPQLKLVFPTVSSNNTLTFTFEDGRSCADNSIDVFLVPGLAFDRSGRRLGRGSGHYDRALANAPGWKIGLAGSYQISNEDLPEEDHDIRMDAISTEKFILFPIKHSTFFKGAY